ncbi:hypothetical protein CcaverHIS002_0507630 [Cutaneotrichosporon cavernicola]|uniref:Uncharacterized protein n=1 Tax=Cutaneotrichosporon cavernicola TaxID=279322 RepID=A0AA48L777_9TREE|nr:uncharacterized protein CcaverHIS019_0508190 [Cutaneotrichosporon cavernicola]BEI85362.1 hypothetical protein CcaverHIS002_0507630 [Cutaneotrichosporon cavernicola]BEI93191.1 hypothetical protein CcaverHIS019_0508190 [Cutaneotrichosporon cavernicola]BEJ00968.1 hypothetical protein CcaverHIS631_0508250 [Cutaneotrichosporon cavernicola]BEJ08733.1 hypothetical protein CcaverHIS641_0508270 [Cutaneotrichosporon cavernicola]
MAPTPIPTDTDIDTLSPLSFILVLTISGMLLVSFAAISFRRPESQPLISRYDTYLSIARARDLPRSRKERRRRPRRTAGVPKIQIIVVIEDNYDNAAPAQDTSRLCVPSLEALAGEREDCHGWDEPYTMSAEDEVYLMHVLSQRIQLDDGWRK